MFKLTKNLIPAYRTDPLPEVAPVPSARPAAYEIADLGALDAAARAELRAQIEADHSAGAPGCPHLVVTSDRRTGLVHHHVPCSSGREAVRLAEQVVADRPLGEARDAFTVTVTPLLPHQAHG